jgi:hypothetical protein
VKGVGVTHVHPHIAHGQVLTRNLGDEPQ